MIKNKTLLADVIQAEANKKKKKKKNIKNSKTNKQKKHIAKSHPLLGRSLAFIFSLIYL